jgi:hypothetical protein
MGAALAGIYSLLNSSVISSYLYACPKFINSNVLFDERKHHSFINSNDYIGWVFPFLKKPNTILIGDKKWWKPWSFNDHLPKAYIASLRGSLGDHIPITYFD